MKGLHNITPAAGSRRRTKRRGRGNSSGSGNYSGRGIKGQRARSGGRNRLVSRSMKSYLLRIPKKRGFTSKKAVWLTINVKTLAQYFNEGDSITPQKLRAKGLITGTGRGIKILADGAIGKKLSIRAHNFSSQAKAAIEKAGGTVDVITKTAAAESKASTPIENDK